MQILKIQTSKFGLKAGIIEFSVDLLILKCQVLSFYISIFA